MTRCQVCGDTPFSVNRRGVCLRCTHGAPRKSPEPHKRPASSQRIPAIYDLPCSPTHRRQLAVWQALSARSDSASGLAQRLQRDSADVWTDLLALADQQLVIRERGTKQWFCLVQPPIEHAAAPSADTLRAAEERAPNHDDTY